MLLHGLSGANGDGTVFARVAQALLPVCFADRSRPRLREDSENSHHGDAENRAKVLFVNPMNERRAYPNLQPLSS